MPTRRGPEAVPLGGRPRARQRPAGRASRGTTRPETSTIPAIGPWTTPTSGSASTSTPWPNCVCWHCGRAAPRGVRPGGERDTQGGRAAGPRGDPGGAAGGDRAWRGTARRGLDRGVSHGRLRPPSPRPYGRRGTTRGCSTAPGPGPWLPWRSPTTPRPRSRMRPGAGRDGRRPGATSPPGASSPAAWSAGGSRRPGHAHDPALRNHRGGTPTRSSRPSATCWSTRATGGRSASASATTCRRPARSCSWHSLGGVACVDLLVEAALPQVELLVTVGSQAPFFYEIDALQSLRFGVPLPEHFPRWLNVYDLRDFLSYVAAGVFAGAPAGSPTCWSTTACPSGGHTPGTGPTRRPGTPSSPRCRDGSEPSMSLPGPHPFDEPARSFALIVAVEGYRARRRRPEPRRPGPRREGVG